MDQEFPELLAHAFAQQVEVDMGMVAEKYNFMKSLNLILAQKTHNLGFVKYTLEEALLSINVMEKY